LMVGRREVSWITSSFVTNKSSLPWIRSFMFSKLRPLFHRSDAHSTVECAILICGISAVVLAVGTTIAYRARPSGALIEGLAGGNRPAIALDEPPRQLPASSSVPESPRQFAISTSLSCATALLLLTYLFRNRLRRRRGARRRIVTKRPEFDTTQKRAEILAILRKHKSELAHWELLVEHVMSPSVDRVSASAKRSELDRILSENPYAQLVVCDKRGAPVGVITASDVDHAAGHDAKSIMTADVVTIDRKVTLSAAVTLMLDGGFSCLPVISQGVVCGILTSQQTNTALLSTSQLLKEIHEEHRRILLGTLSR
jgi:CBS domain-containing protein